MSTNPFEETQTRFTGVIRDRRRFPRVMLDRRGEVALADGDSAQVTIHDVSPDGLQIRCSRDVAVTIRPSGRAVSDSESPSEIRVALTLPLRAGPVPVGLPGRLLYFALINHNLVAMGIEFTTLSSRSRRFLDTFIEQSLEPA